MENRTTTEFNKYNQSIIVHSDESEPEKNFPSTIVSRKLDFSSSNISTKVSTAIKTIVTKVDSDSDSSLLDLKNSESIRKFVTSIPKTQTIEKSNTFTTISSITKGTFQSPLEM